MSSTLEQITLKNVEVGQPFQLVNSKWKATVFVKDGPATGKFWDAKRREWTLITIDPDSAVKTEFLGF